MQSMPTIRQEIRAFEELRSKGKYGYLERLQLRRALPSRGPGPFCVEMDLRPVGFAPSRLLLSFEGVPHYHMRDLDGILFYLIQIESIADRQLEGLKYRVYEDEYSAFSFMCRSFSATVEPVSD
jgi:hypothetical protein